MSILSTINGPEDVQGLGSERLPQLASDIREKIIQTTSRNGGHIGPNLGVVELTLALHRVFDFNKDLITFDVAHQGYVHKLLTGRNGEDFDKLRQTGGVSGFLARYESKFDNFGAGHAGTALSAALGMAKARDLKKSNDHVISVIGDAALTCGITMEALNNISTTTKKLIVILNDNEWSIAKNVGAISNYLNELITNPVYNRLHKDLKSFLEKIPCGNAIKKLGSKAKQETKDFFVPSSLFEKFGLRYIGPIDGHDLDTLNQYLEFAKNSEQPILLHVITQKGRGYEVATKNPEKFHGTGPFNIQTGCSAGNSDGPPKYESVFGQSMVKFAGSDEKVLGITAAMPSGTGLIQLQKAYPKQFFDVGIAEEHAVLFAAGLATQGFKPVCAIYSTFLQRAFDPIVHDVCLQDLDVTFCMDRAGLSPNDGPTHHGLFDIAYLRGIPRVTLMQPINENELVDMLYTSLNTSGPMFIRYPRGAAEGVSISDKPQMLEIGKAEVLKDGSAAYIWALGPMANQALCIAKELETEQNLSIGVVNARFAKPLDEQLLAEQAQRVGTIITLEDHVITGGFGSAVTESISNFKLNTHIERIGWPDQFIPHGSSVDSIRKQFGLDYNNIKNRVISSITAANIRVNQAKESIAL